MLTEHQIATAEPRRAGYKMSDSRGLHVFVTPSGSKSFRFKYRFGGVEKRLTFGLFPAVSLVEARRLREAARLALKAKHDPGELAAPLDPGTVDRLGEIAASAGQPDRLYFLRGEGGMIKIGVARNVRKRVASLQADHPVPLVILGAMPGSYADELTVHRLFVEDRQHGEWFRPSQRLLDFIEDNTSRRGLVCR